jgi:3',5'-cyclic AMP phosphodiesterase CpdA
MRSGPRPDAVLHTGDIAHDATHQDYAMARAALSQLACPLYATIGNRDRRAPFQNAFASDGYLEGDIGFVQFAVNLGSLRIVAVDTLDDQSYLGAFSRSGRSTLNACLARAPGSQRSCFYIIPQLLHPVLLSNFVIRPAPQASRMDAQWNGGGDACHCGSD